MSGSEAREGLSPLAALAVTTGVLGFSAVLGMRNAPDPLHPKIRRWYKRLDKPSYTPPDPVFGAAWPLIETGLAVGGYRLLRKPASPGRSTAVALWVGNVAMIGGWTEIFFRRHELGASAIASGAMVAGGAGLVAVASKVDRPAAALAVPYVAWLGFATLLATRVWQRNAEPQVQ
jgi:tryptophan-rich sensory protein